MDVPLVTQAVARLSASAPERGLCVVRAGPRVQLVTAPDTSAVVERFLGMDRTAKLSTAAMETLSIIAYRQPLTRASIDAIRGVNSDGVLRTLVAKSLIESVGRLDQAGRPILYGTTFEFMQYFGISGLDELPSLPELDLGGEEEQEEETPETT